MNYFTKALIAMLVVEATSLLAFNWPILSLPLLAAAAVAVFVLSWKNPEWGIYVLFAELFFGSRGHLLEYDLGFVSISLRLVVFAAVFLSWAVKSVILRYSEGSRDSSASTPQNDKSILVYSLLLVIIGFAILNGYLQGNWIGNVFNDANGYLYLLILPAVVSAIKTKEQIQNILQILAAAIVVIAMKTLGLFLWFSFGFPGVATAYHWIISQDFGEITGDVGSASRIFMQSQFWALMGLFIFALSERKNWLVIAASILSILMSLSRSFWLGAIAGGLFVVMLVLWHFRPNFKAFLALGIKLGLIAILEIGLLYGIVSIGGNGIADSVSSRSGNPIKEAAGGARLLLLPELLSAIKQAPIAGSGFGKLVTYKSFLPDRVTQQNPDGEITNFAFEWGYLDIALKVGIIGLLIYLFFVANIFREGWQLLVTRNLLPVLGFLSALAALLVLNVTTPYLNHPLGIGFIILCAVVFNIYGQSEQPDSQTAAS